MDSATDATKKPESSGDSRFMTDEGEITFVTFTKQEQMQGIVALIDKDLSEPYSIYTYRYFINNWPHLCFMAMLNDKCIGTVVSKLDKHRDVYRGYIAMLAVDKDYRLRGLGSKLVSLSIEAMMKENCEEVVLETEITNKGSLALYTNLGFVKDKRLYRYYMNGVDAFRLKLFLPVPEPEEQKEEKKP